jgi:hypothetical protein
MWIRNTSDNHGCVFVHSVFKTRGDRATEIARAPTHGGKNYPYCEAVLIDCVLSGIDPRGWREIGGDTTNVHYWEYRSMNLSDGKPVDVHQRHPASRQLTMDKDAEVIANYRSAAYVLGGWKPKMVPLILSQPESVSVQSGETAIFRVQAAAIPKAEYQWLRNGQRLRGATGEVLTLENAHEDSQAAYAATMTNEMGTVTSRAAMLRVK